MVAPVFISDHTNHRALKTIPLFSKSISAKNILFYFNKLHLHVLRNIPALFHYPLILLSCPDAVAGVFPIISRPLFRCSFTQVISLVTSQLPKMKSAKKLATDLAEIVNVKRKCGSFPNHSK